MTILAIDSSSRAASCALLRDGTLVGEFFLHTGLTHSQTLLPMVENLLSAAGQTVEEVDVFAVSTGPGSFTGLRIGISTVKGLAVASPRTPAPLCAAVPTLEALAENLSACTGFVVPVMDARRAQVYTAVFACQNGVLSRRTGDAALPLDTLREQLQTLAPEPVYLVGDGALLAHAQMTGLPHVRVAPEHLLQQRAGCVAAVALRMAQADALCTAGALAPFYLRMPQAERERLAKLQIHSGFQPPNTR